MECAAWIEQKVDIKTIKQSNLLHGKMYHVDTAGVKSAIVGSSNFTVRGLGLGNVGNNNFELNLVVDGRFVCPCTGHRRSTREGEEIVADRVPHRSSRWHMSQHPRRQSDEKRKVAIS
ncbi:MAG: phospholipase D-like domain-containing protein [Verrucomicrobiota bacterium]